MSVACYFSGVESEVHWRQCTSVGVRNVLMSYWQFYKSRPDLVRKRKRKHPEMQFMIDSGAHSFIADWTKFKDWKRQDFEHYVKGYVAWLRANKKYIKVAVEFDIDYCLNMVLGGGNPNSTVGPSIVESWQRQYFIPLMQEGLEIIFVWHTERRIEGWEDMCARFPYVGLPGELSSEKDFNRFMVVARRYCAKVHGFAATKQRDFRDVHWTSIDSITWKTGEMYGTLIDWNPKTQRLTFEDDKSRRILYRHKMEQMGFDAEAIIRDSNYKEVTRYSLASMRGMESFYAEKQKDRLFYYELRLPPHQVLAQLPQEDILFWWKLFRPETLFKTLLNEPIGRKRRFLMALSMVQYGDSVSLSQDAHALKFLEMFFPKLANPLVSDMRVFQKELASYVSPPNPPTMKRVEPDHFEPDNNPPKPREFPEFRDEEVELDHSELPDGFAASL